MPLRVAAYCRVSTDREDQANSLHSQKTYFQEYIRNHPDWTLVRVFADEGLSGTSTKKRKAFQCMIEAAEAGEIDLILTKEVSRFARNTVDALGYTRRLRELGVGVLFINDNIDTRDGDGELRLSIMATLAQEESRKTSSRVKWGQKRRMESGVVFGNNSTYGFETKGGRLTVKPEEAEVVRLIYHKFLDEGKGTHVIARELYEQGIAPPKTATGVWSGTMIHRILKNEKHAGDLLQKKYITSDYLTHRKVRNNGQEEQIYLRGHHEPIVDRATWDAVQRELSRRSAQRGAKTKYSNRYWCSGKIRCGSCGSCFTPRTTTRPNGEVYRAWACRGRVQYGNWKPGRQDGCAGCNMRMINEKSLAALVRFVVEQIEFDREVIACELLEDIGTVKAEGIGELETGQIEARRAEIWRKKEKLLDTFLSGQVTSEEMSAMKKRYDDELRLLEGQLRCAAETQKIAEAQQAGLDEVLQVIRACLNGSGEVFGETIESITVFEEYVEVKVCYVLPVFRIWYSTRGRCENYTTVIDRCEMLEPQPQGSKLPPV